MYDVCVNITVKVLFGSPVRCRNLSLKQDPSRLPSKEQLRRQKRNTLAYQESTCPILSVTCPYTVYPALTRYYFVSILFLNIILFTLPACRRSVDNLFHTLIAD